MWKKRIIDYLEAEDRSQAWLARKAGMDQHYLSAILNDLRQPGTKVLRKLDRVMGLAPGTLTALRSQTISPEWYGKLMWCGPASTPMAVLLNQASCSSVCPESSPRRPWAINVGEAGATPLPQRRVPIQSTPSSPV